MDIFVRGLPANIAQKQVERTFEGPLAEFGIKRFACDKFVGRDLAKITVLDRAAAQRFLDANKSLFMHGKRIFCSKSRDEPSKFSIRALAYAASESTRKAEQSTASQLSKQNAKITRFAIQYIACGQWDYSGDELFLASQYLDSRQGTISFGLKEAVIVLAAEKDRRQKKIHFNYYDCRNILLGQYDDAAISFTLKNAPKCYDLGEDDVLADALLSLTLGSRPVGQRTKSTRVTGIDESHARIAGMCFVYRVLLSDHHMISTVRGLLSRNVKAPPGAVLSTRAIKPQKNILTTLRSLEYQLTDQKLFGSKPFSLLYQLYRLATNGVLPPHTIIDLLPKVSHIYDTYGLETTLSALRKFYRQVPFAGPFTWADEISKSALHTLLENLALSYQKDRYSAENPYELTKRHAHINLIHKVFITPCGVYLEGPEPERTNRVLRRCSDHIEHFVRVVFQDEDGGSVRYDPRASHELIFHERFKNVLDKGLIIAGRSFSFLGFSHSSLRSQSCWFMAPVFAGDTFKFPEHVLKDLGNFENIRIPAKCAARIGQNFTDTNATVDLEETEVGELAMVQRGSYDFSDGVGTISLELLERVWRVYGQRRMLKPTAVQIRYKGFKGMVSLDCRLSGQHLMLRENMKKFEAPNVRNLEICGAAFKPLPMILNRQFIKIFEDLGIEPSVFMALQTVAVDEMRERTESGINASSFLDEKECVKATRLPSLLKLLDQIGLDYRQDGFLYSVVELVLVSNLRDMKYRGRIPVKAGVTLYGIMDETGQLKEGEIYCVTEKAPEGGRHALIKDRVVVTRSPALHPGDIQIARAVDVPPNSPLRQLSNVVVFSQHGQRDLPSQLSGGDLDGDLYNVTYDSRLLPHKASDAAEYPRVSAEELDRQVTAKDMSDFFVKFMESDLLGMLSNIHMQLADQSEDGVFDPRCKQLASMASTAVDFSKTGVPVDMKDCPKYDRCRPDFMAPSPRIVLSERNQMDIEEDEEGEDEAFEGIDAERRALRCYESEKVLGSLYRAIDERKFLAKMREQRDELVSYSDPSTTLLDDLLTYLKRETSQNGILWEHHLQFAREIRAGYEDSLLDILYSYEPSPNMPVSEVEAFAGTILGRQTGSQGKPLRDLSKTMRERFEAVVEYTVVRVIQGDEFLQGGADLDLLYDDSLDREVEALPRAMACLFIAMKERGTKDRALGELVSFRYVAAGLCLNELLRFRTTTMGSYVLPAV